MMAFVKHDESEAIAQAFHVQVGRIIGGDGDRLDVVGPAAQEPDLDSEAQAEFVVPLVQKVDCRGDDQGRPRGALDRHVGQMRLAGSGRQHDHASAALIPPCFQCLDLVRERLLGNVQPPVGRLVGPGRIGVSPLFPAKLLDDQAIAHRWGAELPRARVELHARQVWFLALHGALDDKRARVEEQPQRRGLPVGGRGGRTHGRSPRAEVKLDCVGTQVTLIARRDGCRERCRQYPVYSS